MAGKAFAVIEIDGDATTYATVANFSGGATNPKTREVPETGVGGTMRQEPTGGVEREDIELSFLEREDEGLFLDGLHVAFTEWRDAQEPADRRKGLSVAFYRDKEFTKLLGRLEVTGAWPKAVSNMEFDRSSDDPREFTVTLTHLGSAYKGTVAS